MKNVKQSRASRRGRERGRGARTLAPLLLGVWTAVFLFVLAVLGLLMWVRTLGIRIPPL